MDSMRRKPLIVNDSDYSDREYGRTRTIEDMAYEMDLAKFYKDIRDNLISHNSRKSKKSSKVVQTEPDTSGIPPSWLILHAQLTNELQTGLANMINKLYHTPNGCYKDAAKGMLDHPNVKHFTHEKRYLQSRLVPDIRIPRRIHSEEFRTQLFGLLEKARMLQNGIPYIMEEFRNQIVDEGKTKGANEITKSKADVKGKVGVVAFKELPDDQQPSSSSTGFSENYDLDSLSEFDLRSLVNGNKLVANVTKKDSSVVSNRAQILKGVVVSKYMPPMQLKLPLQTSRGIGISVPNDVSKKSPLKVVNSTECIYKNNRRNGLIIIDGQIADDPLPQGSPAQRSRERSDPETNVLDHCASNNARGTSSKMQTACHSNKVQNNPRNGITGGKAECPSKNFIKMNILASKFPPHRGATVGKSIKCNIR